MLSLELKRVCDSYPGHLHREILTCLICPHYCPSIRDTLSCPGFHGQLIRRHFNGLVLHGRLITQRLMKSFTIVKQFDVLKDFASCFITRLKVAVVNEFIL